MHGVHPARRILFYIVRPPSDCHLKAVCFFLQDKVKNTVLSYTKNRKMKKSTICKSKKADFLSFMQNQIQEKKMRNKIKTSANYQSSLRSFTHFLQTKGYCRSVSFESITEELIASYETYNTNVVSPKTAVPFISAHCMRPIKKELPCSI